MTEPTGFQTDRECLAWVLGAMTNSFDAVFPDGQRGMAISKRLYGIIAQTISIQLGIKVYLAPWRDDATPSGAGS